MVSTPFFSLLDALAVCRPSALGGTQFHFDPFEPAGVEDYLLEISFYPKWAYSLDALKRYTSEGDS